jgi:hypothetical protein
LLKTRAKIRKRKCRIGPPVRRTKEVTYTLDRISAMCSKLVEITDQVLDTEPWMREGQDARRLFRVTVKQMQTRADLSGDPLVIATVYDALAKLRDYCPQ